MTELEPPKLVKITNYGTRGILGHIYRTEDCYSRTKGKSPTRVTVVHTNQRSFWYRDEDYKDAHGWLTECVIADGSNSLCGAKLITPPERPLKVGMVIELCSYNVIWRKSSYSGVKRGILLLNLYGLRDPKDMEGQGSKVAFHYYAIHSAKAHNCFVHCQQTNKPGFEPYGEPYFEEMPADKVRAGQFLEHPIQRETFRRWDSSSTLEDAPFASHNKRRHCHECSCTDSRADVNTCITHMLPPGMVPYVHLRNISSAFLGLPLWEKLSPQQKQWTLYCFYAMAVIDWSVVHGPESLPACLVEAVQAAHPLPPPGPGHPPHLLPFVTQEEQGENLNPKASDPAQKKAKPTPRSRNPFALRLN